MSLEPPPRIVDKFVNIWRDWLYFFWEFVDSHTGGSSPTPPATGTSWNAHGNTATGEADNPLVIDAGSFLVKGATGNTPADIGISGTYLAWISGKGSLRAGRTIGTDWVDANIGDDSLAIGYRAQALDDGCVSIGYTSTAGGNPVFGGAYAIAMGQAANAPGSNAIAIGASTTASGNFFATAIGYAAATTKSAALSVGVGTQATADGAVVIGTGKNFGSDPFINNKANALMMGANIGVADLATLTLFESKCGIENESPLSTLDVGGSVGFKYDLVTATNGGSSDLTDEYVVLVDMGAITSTNTFIINLPNLGATTIDRRIYYIKFISTTGNWPPSTTANSLQINPGNNDGIEEIDGGAALAGQFKSDGVPLNFSFGGGSGNRGAALTLIADNDLGGWWVI